MENNNRMMKTIGDLLRDNTKKYYDKQVRLIMKYVTSRALNASHKGLYSTECKVQDLPVDLEYYRLWEKRLILDIVREELEKQSVKIILETINPNRLDTDFIRVEWMEV